MPFYPSGRGPEDRSGIYIQIVRSTYLEEGVISPVCYIHSSARWRHTFLSPFLAANRSLAVPILYGDTPPCDSLSRDVCHGRSRSGLRALVAVVDIVDILRIMGIVSLPLLRRGRRGLAGLKQYLVVLPGLYAVLEARSGGKLLPIDLFGDPISYCCRVRKDGTRTSGWLTSGSLEKHPYSLAKVFMSLAVMSESVAAAIVLSS